MEPAYRRGFEKQSRAVPSEHAEPNPPVTLAAALQAAAANRRMLLKQRAECWRMRELQTMAL